MPVRVNQCVKKDLAIVIVSYRGWARLLKCLESLDQLTGNDFSTEVIVVDNKSEDDRIRKFMEQYPRFRFVHNTVNGGFANGCNIGAKSASGEFLLFLNPDTVVTESALIELLNVAKQNPACTILSCRQKNEKGKECVVSGSFPQFRNLTGLQRVLFRQSQRRDEKISQQGSRLAADIEFPDWVSGSVLLIRKEAFLEIGGFDEDFWMYFEDVDLCKRAREAGGEVGLSNKIVIEHNHGGSSRVDLTTESITKTEVHISRHIYISKHTSGFHRFRMQTFLMISNFVSGAIMAAVGLIFFFVPKLFGRTLIFMRLLKYYFGCAANRSWISPRSVNSRCR